MTLPMARSVVARYLRANYAAQHPVVAKHRALLDELGLKVEMDGESISLIPKDPAARRALPQSQMLDAGTAGQIMLSRVLRKDRMTQEGLDDLEGLRQQLRRKGLQAQAVTFVRVRPELKGKGLGSVLYEIALYNAHDGFGTATQCALVPASAMGSSTSDEADRVWKSLARKHPHVGVAIVYK